MLSFGAFRVCRSRRNVTGPDWALCRQRGAVVAKPRADAPQEDMTLQPQPTITSLLNSLHTHLQTQTQLLPTLHAQLGLPPTALADELSSLQQALTRCVEDQISSRRKQVLELEERCENLESECHSYSLALGPSAKGMEITAMELRREPILPRRHDQLAELQEKLRQVSNYSRLASHAG
jgi:protein regulator of cytokinesis 1